MTARSEAARPPAAGGYRFRHRGVHLGVEPPGSFPIALDPANAREPFVLLCDLEVMTETCRVRIPAGFRYDGASVPRWAWYLIPRTDARIWRAATVHDWLYARQIIERAVADGHFLAIMKQDKMPSLKRWLAYLAVRMFGGRAWRGECSG